MRFAATKTGRYPTVTVMLRWMVCVSGLQHVFLASPCSFPSSVQFSSVQFSSVQFKIVYAPSCLSLPLKSSQRETWKTWTTNKQNLPAEEIHCLTVRINISNVRLIHDSTLSSSASFFHASLRQAIESAMSLAMCPQLVFQAPQHSRSSETQAVCGGCFTRHPVSSVISLDFSTSRPVRRRQELVCNWVLMPQLSTVQGQVHFSTKKSDNTSPARGEYK